MYPQQKNKRDWMRMKKRLAEMSPEERTKYTSEHRAKVNEAILIQKNTQNWFQKRQHWPDLPRRGHPKSQYIRYNRQGCQPAVDKHWSV